MSKYIKLEDAISEADRLLGMVLGTDFNEGVEHGILTIKFALLDIPTIEIPTELNGVILKDCDKVIEPFLEEHECDELWETVRALRDFYDWVTEGERKEE